jgi:predicted DNA-binding transcriptional regulator AlpA
VNDGLSPDKDRLLKVPEIAAEMRADEKTVYRRIQALKLPAFKEGGRWVIWRSALLVYLRKGNSDGQHHAGI